MESIAESILTTLQEEREEEDGSSGGGGGGNSSSGKTLVLLSAYKLGKERILLHVAKRTGLKVRVWCRRTMW